jgi:hypothetical protein
MIAQDASPGYEKIGAESRRDDIVQTLRRASPPGVGVNHIIGGRALPVVCLWRGGLARMSDWTWWEKGIRRNAG